MANWLDKAISYLSPVRGAKRARARQATRTFEGAGTGRRWSSSKAQHLSANAELMTAIRPLRDRCRELTRNTPHAPRMLKVLVGHSVGTGIVPVSNTGKDKLDKRVNQLWADWVDVSDVTGQQNFYAQQALAVRSMIESGEVVGRFIDREIDFKVNSSPLPVPMQLQLLEADYIDQFRDGIYGNTFDAKAVGVTRSRLGVGLGEFDKLMGLWLFRNHPGELNTIWQLPYMSDFVPMGDGDLIHMFEVGRPGQVRGVPWFAPVLLVSRDLEDIMDAVNVKLRTESCFAGFIYNDEDYSAFDESQAAATWQTEDQANPDALMSTIEPGMMKELRAGQKIEFSNPTGTTQIEPVLLYNLQAMAAAVGCTYDQASGDLRQANYSSLRAGKLEFWRLIAQLQKHVIIPKLCKPTWSRFISRAVLAGELPDLKSRGGYPVDWIVPAKEPVDPKKDLDAEKNEVRAGRVTPQDFVASRGGNWRETQDQYKLFFDRAHELGLVFDTDASKVDQHGRAPRPTAPGKGGADGATDAEDEAMVVSEDAADDADASDDADRSVVPLRR